MQTKRLVETNLYWIIAYSVLRVKGEFPPLSKAGVVEFIGGVPLSEYIRRRKMSLAAVDLQGGGAKIVDVALKYGYSSPTAMWAIFPGSGTGRSIQELERRIVTEWLPTSGYEFTEGPDIEVYFEPDPQNTSYEVWIPVRKSRAEDH